MQWRGRPGSWNGFLIRSHEDIGCRCLLGFTHPDYNGSLSAGSGHFLSSDTEIEVNVPCYSLAWQADLIPVTTKRPGFWEKISVAAHFFQLQCFTFPPFTQRPLLQTAIVHVQHTLNHEPCLLVVSQYPLICCEEVLSREVSLCATWQMWPAQDQSFVHIFNMSPFSIKDKPEFLISWWWKGIQIAL